MSSRTAPCQVSGVALSTCVTKVFGLFLLSSHAACQSLGDCFPNLHEGFAAVGLDVHFLGHDAPNRCKVEIVKAKKEHAKPVQHSQELADKICDRLAAGETLWAVCESDGMPIEMTVRRRALNADSPFSSQYAR